MSHLLPFASSREVVLAAVAEYGDALIYASKELRADRYIVNFAKACSRPQKLWKLLTVRFFVVLFVKKLQRRVEERDFEIWDEMQESEMSKRRRLC